MLTQRAYAKIRDKCCFLSVNISWSFYSQNEEDFYIIYNKKDIECFANITPTPKKRTQITNLVHTSQVKERKYSGTQDEM